MEPKYKVGDTVFVTDAPFRKQFSGKVVCIDFDMTTRIFWYDVWCDACDFEHEVEEQYIKAVIRG